MSTTTVGLETAFDAPDGAAADTAPSRPARAGPDWDGHVTRIAAGDSEALAALYDASARLVHSLVRRLLGDPSDAEEVTLEVFTQVWRDAFTFDRRRGTARAWLCTLARSRALDRLRRRASRRRFEASPPADMPERPDPSPSPEQSAQLAQLRARVRRALGALPTRQREVIELAYTWGLTQSELAGVLDLPLGTIKTRVRQGLIGLRFRLADPGDWPRRGSEIRRGSCQRTSQQTDKTRPSRSQCRGRAFWNLET